MLRLIDTAPAQIPIQINPRCPCCGQPLPRDPERKEAERRLRDVAGGPVSLRVLACLLDHFGEFVPGNDLVMAGYGNAEDGGPDWADANVRRALMNMRKRFSPLGIVIDSRYGHGYRIRLAEDTAS